MILLSPSLPSSQVLQSVSNLQLEMDAKEGYMQPMNPVLPDGVGRLKVFIQDLVQVDQKTGMFVSMLVSSALDLHSHAFKACLRLWLRNDRITKLC